MNPNSHAAPRKSRARARPIAPSAPRLRERSLAWAAYAASVWALAYAIGVRGYQGIGGTLGLAGTFDDPDAMRRASLLAGAGILLAGLSALSLVRPWGLRLPRWLIIIPALTGSALRDRARAGRLRHQAAAPARRHRPRVPWLG